MVESWLIIEIQNKQVRLNIPTPTPAPDRGGSVACLGGPVAIKDI